MTTKRFIIGGIIMSVFTAFLINILHLLFVTDTYDKQQSTRIASRFITETKALWNITRNDFYHARRIIVVSRRAKLNEEKSLNDMVEIFNKHKKKISEISNNISGEDQHKLARSILILISNATDELKRALVMEDQDSVEKCIDNANKEIDLASVKLMRLSEYYDFPVDSFELVSKELDP